MLLVRVKECIPVAFEQGLMGVHSRPVRPGDRLWHERGVSALILSQLLDHQFGRHHTIRHGQGVCVLQVDLVLAVSGLVVGVLYGYAHIRQDQYGFSP